MGFWKIRFPKLPDINNVTIKNEDFRFNRFQIIEQFIGMTAVGSEMNIGKDYNFNRSFFQRLTF